MNELNNLGIDVNAISSGLVNWLVAIVLLVVFYIIARIVRGIVRRLFRKTNWDNQFAQTMGVSSQISLEKVLGEIAFWLVMIFGIIAVLNRINLGSVSQPLQEMLNKVTTALPNLGYALLLMLLAFVVATIVKTGVLRGAEALNLDARLNQLDSEASTEAPISATLANALYWFVFLLFLPVILGRLGLQELVTPLNEMLSRFLNFLPNIISAALVFLIGMFIARVLRQVITGLLSAFGLDRLVRNVGVNLSVTNFIGTLVYTVVMLLTIVQALNNLKIETISAPATNMINMLFSSVPNILGAGLVLAISFVIGRMIANLVTGLLEGANFNSVPARLGLNLGTERTASQFVGYIVLIGVMMLAALAATDMLGFAPLSDVVQQTLGFATQVIIGLVVLAVGVYIANIVYDIARNAGMSNFVSSLARAAILVLVGAMALDRIGIGDDIVQLAFGIGLGAIGIAAALAFGLGSREIAGREVERLVKNIREEDR